MINASWMNSRHIIERIFIEGSLSLLSPAHFGNGESSPMSEMPLMLDPFDGKALLTGTSIAGALRNYLRQREVGYGEKGSETALHNQLFGKEESEDGSQSWLITHDARAESTNVELRDGVVIKPDTRTAEDKKKFDFELLEAGTKFPLRFELLIPKSSQAQSIKRALAIALQGLEKGEIMLGARKRRGFGRCKVENWNIWHYDLTNTQGMLAWLEQEHVNEIKGLDIYKLLCYEVDTQDARTIFSIDVDFALMGSLLIRSGFGDVNSPDAVHLHSKRDCNSRPILSGTSLGGVLRSRALRITKTIQHPDPQGFIDEMFGPKFEEDSSDILPSASRLWVEESVIDNPVELVQSRIKIDRFTGGAYPGALFSEQPVFAQANTQVNIKLTLQNPLKGQIGLLLLLLKDLWTEDLPLGGESSVGRGRLSGIRATLMQHLPGKPPQIWEIIQNEKCLSFVGDASELEEFVKELDKLAAQGVQP